MKQQISDRCNSSVGSIPPAPAAGAVPVLQKLSSPPFPRSGFPLLGILASIYEHVTAVAGCSRPPVAAQPGKKADNTE